MIAAEEAEFGIDPADVDHDALVELDAVEGGAIFGGSEAGARATGNVFERGQRHFGGRQTFEIVQRPDGGQLFSAKHLLELKNFFFFSLGDLIEFGDLGVGEFLGGVEGLALFVFANDLVFEELLQVFVGIAADVAQSDAALFGDMVELLGEFAAAVFGERWNGDADEFAIVGRIEAEIRDADAFFNGADDGGIPRLNGDHRGFGDVQLGDLIERRRRAEVIDANAVEKADGSAAGAELSDFVLEVCQHFVHFGAGVSFYFFDVFESGAARSGGLFGFHMSLRLANHGANGFAHRHSHYIASDFEIKDHDRHMIVAAHGDGRGVHHGERFGKDFGIADFVVANGVGMLFGIFVVDAIDAGGLGDDFGMNFKTAEGGGGIGREIGVRRASGKDDGAAFFEVANGAAADVRFGDLMHLNGGHDAGGNAELFEGILEGQGIDDGGEHAHVVSGDAVHFVRGSGDTAKDVAATENETDLDARAGDFCDFTSERLNAFRV